MASGTGLPGASDAARPDAAASAPGFPMFSARTGDPAGSSDPMNLELLKDVPLRVSVELGRSRMLVRDVLALRNGSVVDLDRPAGAPVDILVNGILIARGEVVVVDEHFGVRITEVVAATAFSAG